MHDRSVTDTPPTPTATNRTATFRAAWSVALLPRLLQRRTASSTHVPSRFLRRVFLVQLRLFGSTSTSKKGSTISEPKPRRDGSSRHEPSEPNRTRVHRHAARRSCACAREEVVAKRDVSWWEGSIGAPLDAKRRVPDPLVKDPRREGQHEAKRPCKAVEASAWDCNERRRK